MIQEQHSTWRRKVNILIVDDDRPVVDFLKGAARATGISGVDTAQSGEEALGRVIRKEYDLVTLDIQMPGASGLEILSVLRSMCPHAVIAVISGHIPSDIDEEDASAADVMISKPIHLEVFSELVEATRQIATARERVRSLSTVSVAGPVPEAQV